MNTITAKDMIWRLVFTYETGNYYLSYFSRTSERISITPREACTLANLIKRNLWHDVIINDRYKNNQDYSVMDLVNKIYYQCESDTDWVSIIHWGYDLFTDKHIWWATESIEKYVEWLDNIFEKSE